MADLTITIKEQIQLPNGDVEVANNKKIITGVNQFTRRTDTISTTFSGSGVEILRFVDSEEQQIAGSFIKGDVKYIRITNLDTTNYGEVYLINTNTEATRLKIDAGDTIMLSNGQAAATSTSDVVVGGYVDFAYFSDLSGLDAIKVKANTANIQLEYVVGSS